MHTDKLWTFEGDLYSKKLGFDVPLRKNYEKTFSRITNTSQFKATLRAGASTDLGGYPLFLITSDGAALDFQCARKEARKILYSIKNKLTDGWRIIGCEIAYEDARLYCDHCNQKIEPAYDKEEAES